MPLMDNKELVALKKDSGIELHVDSPTPFYQSSNIEAFSPKPLTYKQKISIQ
jgi:hypothetical protein